MAAICGRYYVQRLTKGYLVRERHHPGQEPSAADERVRAFHDAEDAHYYARAANELQEKLDARYGRWVKRAMLGSRF